MTLPETELEELRIWDEGGEEDDPIDRYTVVWPDSSYLAMNCNPGRPWGFGQHGAFAEYEPDCDERNGELFSSLGRMISFEDLPEECQSLVLYNLN